MTGMCCTGERGRGRPARRICASAASILPGALAVLLPKCPLCLAAWLTLVTGIGIPAAYAARIREGMAILSAVIAGLAAARIFGRRAQSRSKPRGHGLPLDFQNGFPRRIRDAMHAQGLLKLRERGRGIRPDVAQSSGGAAPDIRFIGRG